MLYTHQGLDHKTGRVKALHGLASLRSFTVSRKAVEDLRTRGSRGSHKAVEGRAATTRTAATLLMNCKSKQHLELEVLQVLPDSVSECDPEESTRCQAHSCRKRSAQGRVASSNDIGQAGQASSNPGYGCCLCRLCLLCRLASA